MKPFNYHSIPSKLIITCLSLILGLNGFAQNWNEIIKTTASDRDTSDEFSYSVSISGNYAIVGARFEGENITGDNTMASAGSAYIFERNGAGEWNEVQKIVASDRAVDDEFGHSVSISGDYAIVGALYEEQNATGGSTMSQAGSAYVFERNGSGVWNEVQKIVASDRSTNDVFGFSVSISGDYAIVGANNDDKDATGGNILNQAGSAYIFERNGSGVWNEVQKIVASNRSHGDKFGFSVYISDNYAIIGAAYKNVAAAGGGTDYFVGSAYVFERNASGVWNEEEIIVASDGAAMDAFGWSVSISGDYAIVGARAEDEDTTGSVTKAQAGSAYLFERNESGVWSEVQKIVASDRTAQDQFGFSVSISGNYAIIGACFEDHDATGGNVLSYAGSAYVFERNVSGVWSEVQKIVASDRAVDDRFGWSVSISGNYTIVGARDEDEDAIGGDTLNDAGSAYIFKNACQLLAGTVNDSICFQDTIYVNGTTYYNAQPTGIEVFTNIGPNNCDSTVTINLTVLSPLESVINQTICYGDSIVVNGTIYSTSVTGAIEVFNNIGPNNCDSTVSINLTVLSAIDTSTSLSGFVITSNQAGVGYQWIDCNNGNSPITGANSANYTVSNNGAYAVVLTMGACSDTSACVSINSVGLVENSFGNDLLLYPNPTDGDFSIDLGKKHKSVKISITDLAGRLIQSNNYKESKLLNLKLEEPAGTYLLMIESGNKKIVIRLIKK